MKDIDLVELVIELHNIARQVEHECGHSDLSQRIRKCADDLHVVNVERKRNE